MNRILLRLLNIRPSEVWLVKNLFLLNLFQSIGVALLLTLSNALFLVQFDISALPKVYMLSAVVLLIINYIYGKLEHHLQIQKLILYLLLVSTVSILLIRLLIYSVQYQYAPVLLLIWYQVIYLLVGSSFWALAAQLFDVRESKRTFGILSAGDTPAKLLGYLFVSAFAGIIGLNNFLFISAICFVISFFFMRRIVNAGKIDFRHLSSHDASDSPLLKKMPAGAGGIVRSFFSNRLILLLSILSFIVVTTLTVLDFTFLSEVKTRYKDDVTLAAFLASFFAIGRLVTILAKITLTSRIEQQFGIKKTLLILPLLLILFVLFILISVRIEGEFPYYLYVFGSMVVLTEVLKSVLQEPMILVLFQPLKPMLRLKGHSLSKGIFAPLGLFFAGFMIYGSIKWTGQVDIIQTSLFLLAICTCWIGVIYLLDRQYMTTLLDSLKKGFFRGNAMLTHDPALMAVLKEKMKSNRPLEVLYAADTAEKLGDQNFTETLHILLMHEHPDVKKFTLKKIREKNLVSFIPDVSELLSGRLEDEVRIECLEILSMMGKSQTQELSAYISHRDPVMQQHALAALFSSGDIEALLIGGEKLKDWISSSHIDDRIAAAQLIGRVTELDLHTSLWKLLHDPAIAVRRAALASTATTKNVQLIPSIIQHLNDPATAIAAAKALTAYGQDVIQYLPDHQKLKSVDQKLAEQYIKIATQVPGDKATTYLESALISEPSEKSAVISALKEKNYIAGTGMKAVIAKHINDELDHANEMIAYHQVFSKYANTESLGSALHTELKNAEKNIFYLLSFIYERQKLLQTFHSLSATKKDEVANALEIVDVGISRKYSFRFIPVLEYLHLSQTAQTTNAVEIDDIPQLLKRIISSYPLKFNSWTAAIAIYTFNKINKTECESFIRKFEGTNNYLLKDTIGFVLSHKN